MLNAILTLFALTACLAALAAPAPGRINLEKATVVTPPNLTGPENRAVTMLVEEVEKRTQIRWPVSHEMPSGPGPVIVVGPISAFSALMPNEAQALRGSPIAHKPEGYQLRVNIRQTAPESPQVLVVGTDARGVLFGVGRLLRCLHMEKQHITLADDLNIATAPHSPIRGHQLGYRPKTNSYDGWNVAMWEQYIRDLAVFGANSVELIPPRSDDDADSPHFPLPPMQMMIAMSRLLDAYGMDVWIWYPAMDPDYSDPKTVEFALHEWGEVFRQLPRVDAVFVPGGDPGHTPPRVLLNLMAKQAQGLHRYHPKAQLWVAPQGFTQAWLDEFLQILDKERPAWLTGLVFGPQVRISLPELRARVPARYPIRHYPDITHCRECQYPPPNWDLAYALTEGREGINPRPQEEAQIVRQLQKYTVGSITYSEGCNDDVNKAIWSALEWDPNADITDVLRDYSRYFISDRDAEGFAQGLLALERNWQGPLEANAGVYTTLQQFQAMERAATPQERLNWRFQQALYRAYYDAYIRSRLLYEQGLEEQALESLRGAEQVGSLNALNAAESLLDQAVTHRVAADWRARVFELAEALFQSIRMQLSVERYQAIAIERGANLDSIDVPLNNRVWLKAQFAAIRQLPDEAERRKQVARIVHWTDPGPGGFYDEPGNLARREHLVIGPGFAQDPGSYASARIGFSNLTGRLTWARHVETLYDTPLEMHYTHLDPHASYKLRVVYGGDRARKVRLVAGDNIEIHPYLAKPSDGGPQEFDLPPAATASGELTLRWYRELGLGGNGRGCQVSEIWLIRKEK
ncbi:MAG TPA: hypothetical protein VKU00_30810 [Chthonomonadaceae bacterium]|nr:hypothetical protein [Chthonomonadaceae bacterium]